MEEVVAKAKIKKVGYMDVLLTKCEVSMAGYWPSSNLCAI